MEIQELLGESFRSYQQEQERMHWLSEKETGLAFLIFPLYGIKAQTT